MKIKLFALILIVGFILCGCMGEIKPLQIPDYKGPDLSMLSRPVIPPLEEGKDYIIDIEKGTVTYTISGQDKLTAKVISEATAYRVIEIIKQVIDVQVQLIRQKDQLIIQIDLQRQYEAKQRDRAEVKAIISEVIGFLGIALAIAGAI